MTSIRDRATSFPSESKTSNISDLCEKLSQSANKAIAFFENKLKADGSYGSEMKDISSYFKSPMMFISAGKPCTAEKILTHIKYSFMQKDGDFCSSEQLKSVKSEYIEYWSYINGWILRAANILSKPDNSDSAHVYFKQFYVGKDTGFLTNHIRNGSGVTDVLTTAHHGLINMEMENVELAISAGNYLCDALKKQLDIQKGFYLRFDKDGKPITDFAKDHTAFFFVSRSEPTQLHFMIGYPCAYLVLLYKKTGEERFLTAAKAYLDFSLSCDKSVYECNFSHKIAWAASLIYASTGDAKYFKAIEKIGNYFIAIQSDNGNWFSSEDINTQFDQSAEIACWFFEINKNLLQLKKR
ncbi:MAG: hypothetical protein ACYCQI_15005 [Gammaproteobacteria bacterium]